MTDLAAAQYTFRPLTPDDADAIAPLHIRIWRETYTGLMSQEKLDGLDPAASAQRWREWLSGDEPVQVLGAFSAEGDLVGWITVGAARDEDAPYPVELWVLNVASEHHGTGLAGELLRRRLPQGPAYLWVVEGNDRAIAFYRKHGFELDGGRVEMPEGNVDLRMVRPGSGATEAASTF